MIVSSRTPEGQPTTCPVCGNRVCIAPSGDTFDAPCPCCGHLLWFPAPGAAHAKRLLRIVAEAYARFGAPDRGTRVILSAMPTERWLPALERFVPNSTNWDDLFRQMWESDPCGLSR